MQQAIPVQRPSSAPLTGAGNGTGGVILTDWAAPSIPTGSLAQLDGFWIYSTTPWYTTLCPEEVALFFAKEMDIVDQFSASSASRIAAIASSSVSKFPNVSA